jgi:hypothetical protein
MHPACDHVDEDILTPPVLERRMEIPLPGWSVLDPVENSKIVSPGQLCNELLHNWLVWRGFSQRSHILKAPQAEALDPRELVLEIVGQSVDHPGPPSLGPLPGEDVPPDRPVEQNQLAVDGERGPNLGAPDAGFELLKELGVARRGLEGRFLLLC